MWHLVCVGLAVCAMASAAVAAPDHDVAELFDPAAINRNICGHDGAPGPDPAFAQLANSPTAPAIATRPPLWPGLGTIDFQISTTKAEAQAYFDQGLRLTYGFNHGEAIRAFRAAQEIDPACAICAWGESLNYGSNINGAMHAEDNAPAVAALHRATRLLTARTPPKERVLIQALAKRYAASASAKRDKLDASYADAMKQAHEAFPADFDIGIAYVEAAMVASPRPWFDIRTNAPRGRIAEAIAVTEAMLAADPHHPGAIHYYIHLAEVPKPEKAEPYADELGSLMPGSGHMVHMPSHIFFRVGRYKDSLNANLAAIAVDEKLIAAVPETSERYRYGLYNHNIHMAMVSASMAGDGKTALALQAKLLASRAPSSFRNDYYAAATFAPLLRFADSATVLAYPKPDEKLTQSVGMWHYARGSAAAWQKDVATARAEADALAKLRVADPGEKKPAARASMLDVAEEVLRARIEIATGDLDAARQRLESAVAIQEKDKLYRGDPPSWDTPLRQSLGLLMLQTGHAADAIPLLRQALIDTPNNAWALYALQQASGMVGDTGAAAEYGKLFARAWLGDGPPDLGRI